MKEIIRVNIYVHIPPYVHTCPTTYQYGTYIWYGMVWFGLVWYVWYGMVWYGSGGTYGSLPPPRLGRFISQDDNFDSFTLLTVNLY
jgi:hypothetical protein